MFYKCNNSSLTFNLGIAAKAASHTTPEAIIKSALVDRLDYEEWLLERVDAGIADVEAGRTYTREAMLKKLGVGSGRKKAA